MRRLLIVATMLLLTAPAWAVETWYFRSTAGEACGPGDREDLSETAGSSATLKTMDGTGDTWNVIEARTIAAGNWQVCTDLTVASGGGQAGRVTWIVQRYNSSCVQQGGDIINDQSANLTSGASGEVCSSTADPGQLAFAAGDLIVVTVSQTQGSRQVDLYYDGAAAGAADSRLTHPDEYVASTRRIFNVGMILVP